MRKRRNAGYAAALAGVFMITMTVVPAHSAAIPISETANCAPANSCSVLEFISGSVDISLKNVSNANITVQSVTLANPAFLFIAGDKNDEVIASAIPAAKNFCNGAVLAPNATCLFTQTYDTNDPAPDNIIDKGQWELENNVTLVGGNAFAATIDVNVLDPTPEPATLLLLTAGMVATLARSKAEKAVRGWRT